MASDFTERMQAKRQADQQEKPRKRSPLPSDPPQAGASREELAAWLTVVLGLGSDPIVSAQRYGRHEDARVALSLRSGQRVSYDRQGDLFDGRSLARRITIVTGADVPVYSAAEAHCIAARIVRIGELLDDDDDRAETRDWCHRFIDAAARNTVEVSGFGTPQQRFEALSVLQQRAPTDLPSYAPPAERSWVVHLADSGDLLVRVGDLAAHVRHLAGRAIPWSALHSRAIEISWQHVGELRQRRPQGDGEAKAHLYRAPAGWDS